MNDFDKQIDRKNTDSLRWNYYEDNVIPLWVADMDFKSPSCVIEALKKRVEHGIFGYTNEPEELKEQIVDYLYQQYNWKINKDWIVFIPSVVSGIYSASTHFVTENDHILVPRPVYHHLRWAPKKAIRNFSEVNLICEKNRIFINKYSLEEQRKSNTKLFLFCNPHNPGGTVYEKKELESLAEYCIKNKIVICSDEIHAGMVLDDNKKHIPIASISKEISKQTITLMSLNKTFNFPGAGTAWAISENAELRKKIRNDVGTIIPETQIFGYISTMAAIQKGEAWRKKLVEYLKCNRDYVKKKITEIQGLHVYKIEASYLAWISCEKLLHDKPTELFRQHGVAIQSGEMFNQSNHIRLNFGTQRGILEEAFNRIEKAIDSLV